ncbi:MAG TPA: ATP-binding protein [Ktedonobacteraceae bacterium]
MENQHKYHPAVQLWQFLRHWLAMSTFAPTWLPRRWRYLIFGYFVAILLQVSAVVITLLLIHLFPSFEFAGSLEVLAVVLVAINWGAGPGMLATLSGAVLLDILILLPHYGWSFYGSKNIVEVLLFFIIGFTISVAASQIERGRRHTERLASSLATERARLAAIIETVPDAVSIYDAGGKVVQLNRAGRENVGPGRGNEALAGAQSTFTLHAVNGDPFPTDKLPVTRALRGETVSGVEARYLDAEGSDRSILVSAAPLYDSEDKMDGVVLITHDISELLQTERRAAEQASELEAIFEAMTDGVFVYSRDGYMLRMNAAFRKLIGLNAENESNFLSYPLHERRALLAMTDELGRPLPLEQWPQSRILGGEVLTEANTADVIFHAFDGRILHLNVSGAPVRNQYGEPVAALCICRDVTERRRLERRTHDALNALLAMAESLVSLPETMKPAGQLTQEASDRMAQKLVELTRDVMGCERVGITAIDPQTHELHSVAVIGLPPEQELLWRTRRPGFHLSDMLVDPAYQQHLLDNEPIVVDITQPLFQNYPNPYDINRMLLVPMSIDKQLIGLISLDYADKEHEYTQEEITFASAVARLVTLVFERERLLRERADARANELALRQANRQMEEFLGMVSHELKTPLTSIKGNTQLAVRQLKNSLQSLEKILGLYEGAEQQSRRLNRLVDDLLDVSRARAGYLDLHPVVSDLSLIVRQSVEEQQQTWPNRTITLDPGDAQIAPVNADADRIAQVIMNYLTNALKYSDEDQPVQVSLQSQGDQVRVSVRDHGPGLSTEQRAYIWERFKRVPDIEIHNSYYHSNAGLGLGLYISKTIIEQHSGQVGVDSTPGEGSTFWFTVPLINEAASEANNSDES